MGSLIYVNCQTASPPLEAVPKLPTTVVSKISSALKWKMNRSFFQYCVMTEIAMDLPSWSMNFSNRVGKVKIPVLYDVFPLLRRDCPKYSVRTNDLSRTIPLYF